MSDVARHRWTFEPRLAAESSVHVDDVRASRIPYRAPRWMFFDVGMTLVHPAPAVVTSALEAQFPARAWTAAEVLGSLVVAAEARHVPWPRELSGDDRVARMWASLLSLPADGAQVLGRCLSQSDLYQEIDATCPAVLRELRARGFRIGAISNSDGTLEEELAHFQIRDLFDIIVDSTSVGHEKPDAAIFAAALGAAGVSPDDAWHIGDGLINDYLAAAAAGLSPVLLDRHGAHAATPVHRVCALSQLLAHPSVQHAARE